MPALSIIVPIYNVEQYLRRCLDSVLAQTFTDFELILVDDGSPDDCGTIVDEYATHDPRIVAIHQNNKGVSAARNAGLNRASGKYVGFVDPDDWIDKEMYTAMVREMEETDSDLSICDWCDWFSIEECREHFSDLSRVINREEVFRGLFISPKTISGTVCNKLFKRDQITTLFDETFSICEDNLFLCQYCTQIRRACYTRNVKYHYFFRANSSIRVQIGRPALGLPARRRMIAVAKEASKKAGNMAEADFLDSCLQFKILLKGDKQSPYYLLADKEFNDYFRSNWSNIISNRNIFWRTKLLYLALLIKPFEDYYFG